MPDVIDALVKFSAGWVEAGTGQDGLPLYRETVKVTLSKPPLLEITREATEEDFEQFAEPYAVFLKTQAGRKPSKEGYPLVLWPGISPAEYEMCAARGIYTVNQLAELKGALLPQLTELVKRAKRMVELQKDVGKFEVIIRGLEQQVEALTEEAKVARETINAQSGMIAMLKAAPGGKAA